MGTTPTRVAIVDDEEPVRRALRRLVQSAGYLADVYPAGAEFIESLSLVHTDCVVLDIHMPHMDGFMVLEQLARTTNPPAVLIITGYDTPAARERLDHAGIAGYLRKPVDGQLLVSAIEQAVKNR